MADWNAIIAAMRVQSGKTVKSRISDDVAAVLEDRFGISVSESDRAFTSNTPGVSFEEGLSDAEINGVESRFGFRFRLI